jgi:hypothetical protein
MTLAKSIATVSTMFDAILRAQDKAVRSLLANYPKGFEDIFKHWLLKYHPGALLVPVQRTAGSRKDLAKRELEQYTGTESITLSSWTNACTQAVTTSCRKICSSY